MHSSWFNRFQVKSAPGNKLELRDVLAPPSKLVDAEPFSLLKGRELTLAYFRRGLAPPVMSSIGRLVGDEPADPEDELFWQYPCRTEGGAWEQHKHDSEPTVRAGELHIYLGLPWASWIDFARKKAWRRDGEIRKQFQLQMVGVRISGLRCALAELDIRLRVHTVCQHIEWRDMARTWQKLGVTDAWLSHCSDQDVADQNMAFEVHPWALFAVNVLDPQRRTGLCIGADPATKPVLASFQGASGPGYLGNVRTRLSIFENEPGFVVRITDKWHFEDVVYSHQIGRMPMKRDDDLHLSVKSYNQLLSDSIFSLCPAGTGPNSLRLWESLAVGAVPVMIGPLPAMPMGGNLPPIDWDEIVVRIRDEQFDDLPGILRSMPMERVRRMQGLGMEAHALVARQRCY